MPDRLTELQQQRRLVQEHLAWLDREIAREQGLAPSPARPQPVSLGSPATPSTGGSAQVRATAAPEADVILAEYEQDPRTLQSDVKRGCFMAFAVALLTLALIVGGAYAYYVSKGSDEVPPPPEDASLNRTQSR